MDDSEFIKTCERKVTYINKKAAMAHSKVLRAKGRDKTKPYKCKYCGLWHLSSKLGVGYKVMCRGGK